MAHGCITHHYACNCREEEFAAIKAERDALRQRIESAPVAQVISTWAQPDASATQEYVGETLLPPEYAGKRVRLVVDEG